MHINAAGLRLIKRWESLRLEAYTCPAGVPTIGYGHTRGVRLGDVIDEPRAEALLLADIENFEAGVHRLLKVPLTENQFSALVSLAFNIGLHAFGGSTLLKRLNAGDLLCADEFMRWNKAGRQVLNGLTARRFAERALFLADRRDP